MNTDAAGDMARRIRALLDKAENTEFTHERDAFTAKALALMAEYRISDAMVEAASDPRDRRGTIEDRDIALGSGPYVRARLSLLCHIATANGCVTVTRTGWEGRVATLHGFQSDVTRSELLYTSLLIQATTGAHGVSTPEGTSTVSVRRSFLFGFAERIGERISEAHDAAVRSADGRDEPGRGAASSTPTVALVLADRQAEVDDYVRRRYGRLGTLRGARVGAQGYGEGRAAGERADLESRRGVEGTRAALLA